MATAKVAATIPLGGGPEFAVSTARARFSSKKNTVTQRWTRAPGAAPTGLALDPAKRRLFTGCHDEQMIVLDADGGTVLAHPAIGKC